MAATAPDTREPRIRDLLRHPWVIAALVVWLLNDHCLKQMFPGWWTGKLSDAAGMVVIPVCLAAMCVPKSASMYQQRKGLAWSFITVAAVFSAIQVWPAAAWLYCHVLGGLQWPWYAVEAWVAGWPIPPSIPVVHTMDATDLWVIPVPVVLWAVVGRKFRC